MIFSESYATAWTTLCRILAVTAGQTVVIRGATSALGQAALNIAAHAGARVIATARNASHTELLQLARLQNSACCLA
jgi:NADPH:quinone reductase-like Zn-dependent oxidoreductase